jgi:hypothetical protein
MALRLFGFSIQLACVCVCALHFIQVDCTVSWGALPVGVSHPTEFTMVAPFSTEN